MTIVSHFQALGGSFGGDDLVKKLVPDANKIYKLFLGHH
jgi:hypothetical protein